MSTAPSNPVQSCQPITEAQRRALTFLLEPWVALWWAGKPHGNWPKELNARTYDKLASAGLISWRGVRGSAFQREVRITDAGRAVLQPKGGGMSEQWEARAALRWGSEHKGWFASERTAKTFAQSDIEAHGNVGRIEAISRDTRTVYYDVHEELT